MEYQYRCKGCSRLFASGTRSDVTRCPDCETPATRVFSFYTATGMREHWNTAVGQYVSTRADMSEALKRKSEEASVRTGIDHDFQYVSPAEMADAEAHGVSRDAAEISKKRQHDHPELYR